MVVWYSDAPRACDVCDGGEMSGYTAAAILCSLFLAGAEGSTGPDGVLRTVFTESQGLVLNPDCGWVAYNYEDGYNLRTRVAGGKEPFRFASAVYTRHASIAWENDTGGFEDSRPLKLLENWIAHERHVALRVYANGVNDLPSRLRADPPTFSYRKGGETHRRVRYWNDTYVAEHRRLVRFLGERLADCPYVAYVDIGGVGNTGGEWFCVPTDEFRRAGLDSDRLAGLVRTFVEMYREAFPHVRLFISYDCLAGELRPDVVELLQRNRVGLRDDGLGGWPYPRQSPRRKEWPMPELWPEMPVLFECGGKGGGVYGFVQRGEDPEAVLKWVCRLSPPTYVNLGGSETASAKACAEMEDLLLRCGRRLGYRFALAEASCPAVLSQGQAFEVSMKWANRGGAPCYADRQIEVSFCTLEGGQVGAIVARPEPLTTQWGPGRQVGVRLRFSLPEGIAPGEYALKVRMLFGDPRDAGRAVNLATVGADDEGRYTVGVVRVAD